jgi:hypothetical protein
MANPHPNTTGLRPWKPGQSGNPAGHSKARRELAEIARTLDAMRQAHYQEMVDAGDVAGALARVLVEKALAGDLDAIKFLVERLDGKPKRAAPAGPLVIRVADVDTDTDAHPSLTP